MNDREQVISNLKKSIKYHGHLKDTFCKACIQSMSMAIAMLEEQEAQKFLVDENGKITPLPVAFPNCPLKEQGITEWEHLWDAPDGTYKGRCKKCGFVHIFIEAHDSQYIFCPSCGRLVK